MLMLSVALSGSVDPMWTIVLGADIDILRTGCMGLLITSIVCPGGILHEAIPYAPSPHTMTWLTRFGVLTLLVIVSTKCQTY